MELERFREKGSDEKDLREACEKLWGDYIRADLIFGRNLWLCLPCLAFFYAAPDSGHSRDQCVLVYRYFSDRCITSPAKLVEFMKEALGTHIVIDTIREGLSSGPTKPTMSKVHLPSAPKRPHLAPESDLKKCKDKLVETQVNLFNSEEVAKVLHNHNNQLKQENEELLIELFREREHSGHIKKIILGLIDQIATICSEGCSCNCSCEQKDSTKKTDITK